MSVLPQELIDVIVDYLEGDEESLRSCLLSSRCLVDRARIHLFHDVTISSPRRLKALFALFGVSPSLPSMIHTVKFSGQSFIVPADWIFTDDTIRIVFRALCNVKEIMIENVRFPRLTDIVSLSSIFPLQQPIQRLALDNMILENGDDLFTLLCALPSVKYLTFGFVIFRNTRSTMAAFPSPPQELRLETLELQFSNNISHSAMLFLREHLADILSTLKHLRIAYMTSHELHLIGLILSQTRDSLITMYIGPMMLSNPSSQQDPNDPILLLSYSHIDYMTVVLDETDPHTSPLKYWTINLSTDDEDFKLKELTISLKVHVEQSDSAFSASFPSAAQWSALEAALCCPQMKKLCRVNLNIVADSGSGYDPQLKNLFARFQSFLEGNCQLLMNRNLLRVDF
ncbi:hypothetical protein DFS33DRAFT_247851 [Desarmillaria ectypa]|nr:hypothetical protein DFS33DRAFT_247851 [Desarmillaria ectypa]